jgi:hypothetical protein
VGNLEFEDKASNFTKRTLTQKICKQSGALGSSPPHADDLQALAAPRSERKMLVVLYLPTPSQTHRPSLHLRGQTTWKRIDSELLRLTEESIHMEVELLEEGRQSAMICTGKASTPAIVPW